MDLRTAHALVRFGMGPSGTENLPDDPASWLLRQLHQPDAALDRGPVPSAAEGLAALRADRQARKAGRAADASAGRPRPDKDRRRDLASAGAPNVVQPGDPSMDDVHTRTMRGPGEPAMADGPADPAMAARPAANLGLVRSAALYRSQGLAAVAQAITTTTPFRERLVWFWTNHFTVSLRHGGLAAVAGAFVQEAIRPHVTGRFEDMVLAVMRHPAMLIYLDNAQSVGPDSIGGVFTHRGLNENLARECMELHTVTPASGYTQADVTAFARILTGWSIELNNEPAGFMFRPRIHEPGRQTVMGRSFPTGEEGGIEALRFLANHPATHRALASKLVCHFVADAPPPEAVRRIEGILRDTGGDLGAAAAGIVGLDAAWTPGTKLRTPLDLVVASFRALEVPVDPSPPYLIILAGLGQPLWAAPAPNGWSDVATDWAAPEAMMRRIDWAFAIAGRIGERDPMLIADTALGPLVRPETQTAMAHAGSRREAMALLLTSSEFQRR